MNHTESQRPSLPPGDELRRLWREFVAVYGPPPLFAYPQRPLRAVAKKCRTYRPGRRLFVTPPPPPTPPKLTSAFNGVHRKQLPIRGVTRYEAQMRVRSHLCSLGTFDNQSEAARAYDMMALWLEMNGERSVRRTDKSLNFPRETYAAVMRSNCHLTMEQMVSLCRAGGVQPRRAAAQSPTGAPETGSSPEAAA